ncbi:class I SAM-dependent methyltransferase [Dyella silvatica]|uniref:class I SAM-dependent methyltransferase n=1 Tax=Dyella silvatica TaxID=2992128 RepID=UPI002259C716|nr:class I SAM-dependent methyltransferase [Dyella silvatica]
MQDAQSAYPVCGDTFAKVFMDERGLQIFESFKAEKKANASNLARARIIDDHLRRALAAHPDLLVVTVGAGFDTRPFRLPGGSWLELDEPQIIAYKNQRLPVADSPNPLQRIAIDFSTGALAEKLAPYARHRPVICVVEGVLLYLDPPARQHLAYTLRSAFPAHTLICDLMTKKFLHSYARSVRRRIADLGASLTAADRPDQLFTAAGYRMQQVTSISRSAAAFGLLKVPLWMLRFMRTLSSGYAIYLFKA